MPLLIVNYFQILVDYHLVLIFFVVQIPLIIYGYLNSKNLKIKKIYINSNLIKKTKRLGMEAIAEAIEKIKNDEINPIPNDNNEKSYYSFPKRINVIEFLKGGNTFY